MALTEKYVSALAGGSGDGLTAGNPFTFAQMIAEVAGGSSAGKRYNIKADGTYSRSNTVDNMWGYTGGTASSPVCFRGYKTTPGDGYLGRDSAGALITTNMPLVTYVDGNFQTPTRAVTESISFQRTAGSGGQDILFQNNHFCAVIGCKISSARTDGNSRVAILGGDYALSFECDFFQTATTGPAQFMADTANAGVRVDSCRFICSSTTQVIGIKCDEGAGFYGCLIKGAGTGAGIYFDTARSVNVRNCTITGWQDGIYWNTPSNDRMGWLAGNMVTDNSRYGMNLSSGAAWVGIIGPGRVRDNASGDTSSSALDWTQAGRIIPLVTTDTGGPETDYTNAANNDYSLISASPAKDGNRPKNSDLGAYGLPTTVTGGAAALHPLIPQIIRPAPNDG